MCWRHGDNCLYICVNPVMDCSCLHGVSQEPNACWDRYPALTQKGMSGLRKGIPRVKFYGAIQPVLRLTGVIWHWRQSMPCTTMDNTPTHSTMSCPQWGVVRRCSLVLSDNNASRWDGLCLSYKKKNDKKALPCLSGWHVNAPVSACDCWQSLSPCVHVKLLLLPTSHCVK